MPRSRRLLAPRARSQRRAALRLRAARRRFERSAQVLCKAALDHIDNQVPVGTMLTATLDRLAAQGSAPA